LATWLRTRLLLSYLAVVGVGLLTLFLATLALGPTLFDRVMGGMMGSGMMGGAMGGMMRQMYPNADLDQMFMQMMIPHHEDAISMANTALQQSQHPEIKTLAQAIVAAQTAEIQEMRGYLRTWYGIR